MDKIWNSDIFVVYYGRVRASLEAQIGLDQYNDHRIDSSLFFVLKMAIDNNLVIAYNINSNIETRIIALKKNRALLGT